MNMLVDLLPTTVVIDDTEYNINSNFRHGILFEIMMLDNTLNDEDKLKQALNLYYPVIPPMEKWDEAIEKILWFYRCGEEVINPKNSSNKRGDNSAQLYSYEFDDKYIYSAFLAQYNIDLQDIEALHWWKYKAMFESLNESNEIVKIMGYRGIDLSKIKDKEQKARYKELKERYRLPVCKDEKEKLNEIENILLNGGDLNKALL